MTKKKKVSKHQQYSNTMHLHPPACTITKKGQAYLRVRTVYLSLMVILVQIVTIYMSGKANSG